MKIYLNVHSTPARTEYHVLFLFHTGFKDSIDRLLHMREKIVGRGIISGAVSPEWCIQNEGMC